MNSRTNPHGYDWTSLPAAVDMANRLKEDLKGLATTLRMAQMDTGEHVAHAFNYAGADDSESNMKGAEVIRLFAGIVDRVEESVTLVKGIENKLQGAVDAIDDSRAKRAEQARRVGLGG